MDNDFEFVYSPELDVYKEPVEQVMLSAGGYGVAFSPAFPCVDGTIYPPKYIGKVFYFKDSANEEWELAKKIQRIESGTTQKYFTYPKYQCQIEFKCPENGTPESALTTPQKKLLKLYE